MTCRAVPQTAIRRAIKAAEGAGLAVAGVEIAPDGVVRILTRENVCRPVTDLDRWKAKTGYEGRAA